jgi:hypothetical protein
MRTHEGIREIDDGDELRRGNIARELIAKAGRFYVGRRGKTNLESVWMREVRRSEFLLIS